MQKRISIAIKHEGKTIFGSRGNNQAYLTRDRNYIFGDYIEIKINTYPAFVFVRLDESLPQSLIYMTKSSWRFQIPLLLGRESPYPEGAFLRRKGFIIARYALEGESSITYNLAANPYDQHSENAVFAHASANFETRNDSVFWAKNAIDGVLANHGHGNYPYQSWGNAGKKTAYFKLDFGRPVIGQKLGILLRADFPHDSYWQELTVEFSHGCNLKLNLSKSDQLQFFSMPDEPMTWLKLENLKIADSHKFAALSQIEVIGHDV